MAAGEPEQNAEPATGRRKVKDYPYFGIEWFVLVHVLCGGMILFSIWVFERYQPFHGRKDISALLVLYTVVWCIVNMVRKPPLWTWH